MKRLIITGDDFGLCREVNEAIEIACRDGVLSAASLMVGEQASADAVARAHRLPDLRVGLHIVLVQGTAVLPPERIPDLVNAEGRFRDGLLISGLRFFLLPGIRQQLEAEIRAQFQVFADSGLHLDHVNAHNHMHLHPTILGLILTTGKSYGLQAMRIPYEPAFGYCCTSKVRTISSAASMLGLLPWTSWMRKRIKRAAVHANDYVFGLNASGHMHEALLLQIIRDLPEGITELYFHPATRAGINQLAADYLYEAELAALTSTKVSALLNQLGITPVGFSDLPAQHGMNKSVRLNLPCL